MIERHGVTVWNSVPALMDLFAQAPGAGAAGARLRLVMLSGDWIPVALPDQLRALSPAARLISLGGATEASIWSMLYPIDASTRAGRASPTAARCGTSASTCSTSAWRRGRSGCRASSTSRGPGSRAATGATRRRPRPASSRIRPPASGCTAPATWAATCPTGRSSSSAARTPRSRSVATASSSARSRPLSSSIRRSCRPRWWRTARARRAG